MGDYVFQRSSDTGICDACRDEATQAVIKITVPVALAGQPDQLSNSAAWVYLSTHCHLQINSMLMALLREWQAACQGKILAVLQAEVAARI